MYRDEYAVEVQNLKLQYKCLRKTSVKNGLFSIKRNRTETVEALKGISFRLRKGEILGVIGKNGSGKSTLVRVLAGIFEPDEGNVNMHGHTVSLMSIGVGFQKKLSGRENILLSGMLLGFRENEIRQKMDEIITFSELGDFIDRPVKTYSSGMYSKLAFSITAILETEIMLIDEVLSVGDAQFKKKSLKKMKQLITDKDRTVIIVSHSNETLQELCDELLWLHEGEVKMQGDTKQVIEAYMKYILE